MAIGWIRMSDVSQMPSRVEFKSGYLAAYAERNPRAAPMQAGQVLRFAREIRVGDYALTYLKAEREVLIGVGEGEYEYLQKPYLDHYPHVRRVQWLQRVSRDCFSASAKSSLGSIMTVFNLDDHVDEIHRLAVSADIGSPQPEEEQEVGPPFVDEVKAQADELVSDLISRLDPYEFQDMVAGLLRAMGFRAVSCSPGPDRGVDIVAHPDPSGFERPHIKAQVIRRRVA